MSKINWRKPLVGDGRGKGGRKIMGRGVLKLLHTMDITNLVNHGMIKNRTLEYLENRTELFYETKKFLPQMAHFSKLLFCTRGNL